MALDLQAARPVVRGRGPLWRTKVLDFHLDARTPFTAAVIVLALTACWGLAVLVGGAGKVPPHWFYVPVILSASWYGRTGTLITSIAAGLLAGPVLPLDTSTGAHQLLSDWVTRAAFFAGIGQFGVSMFGRFQTAITSLRSSEQVIRSLMGGSGVDGKTRRAASEQRNRILSLMDAEDGIYPVYQPIIELRTGRVVGMEALSRFNSETERSPLEWFTDAWEVELGIQLELRALQLAVRQIDALPTGAFLAVNLSPATVISSEFRELVPDLPPDRLVIEMTEHAPVSDYHALLLPVRDIRARGGRIAVDDAGGGFASFCHIVKLNPEIIKLDIGLTRHIDTSEPLRHLATILISYGERIGASIVAEGIETQAEFETLLGLGAECGQGYYLGRPEPMERALALALPISA